MMTTVYLHGSLAKKFGPKFRFEVYNVRQVIDALECARPGFRRAIRDMKHFAFRVKVGKHYTSPSAELLDLPNVGRTIRITPILESAANSKGIWQIVAGVVLIAASIFIPGLGAFAPLIMGMGASLALGGIAQLLSPSPLDSPTENKNKRGYLLNSPVNTRQQGGPVPLLIGEMWLAGVIASAQLIASDVTSGSDNTTTNPPPGGNSGGGGGGITQFYNDPPTKFPN